MTTHQEKQRDWRDETFIAGDGGSMNFWQFKALIEKLLDL